MHPKRSPTKLAEEPYNEANQLLHTEDSIGDRTTYSYDDAGNQETKEEPNGDLTTLTWNTENQNTQVELPSGTLVTYTYNSDLLRVGREEDIDTVGYVWDKQNLLHETDEFAEPQVDYHYEQQEFGNLISRHEDTEMAYYHYDALGSTDALTDSSEVVTDEYTYNAWGKELASTGSTENPFRWVGQKGYQLDPATGIHTLRRREYDSDSGRFLSEDPSGLEDDANLFRYVKNNSTNEIDPAGLEANSSEQSFKYLYWYQLPALHDAFPKQPHESVEEWLETLGYRLRSHSETEKKSHIALFEAMLSPTPENVNRAKELQSELALERNVNDRFDDPRRALSQAPSQEAVRRAVKRPAESEKGSFQSAWLCYVNAATALGQEFKNMAEEIQQLFNMHYLEVIKLIYQTFVELLKLTKEGEFAEVFEMVAPNMYKLSNEWSTSSEKCELVGAALPEFVELVIATLKAVKLAGRVGKLAKKPKVLAKEIAKQAKKKVTNTVETVKATGKGVRKIAGVLVGIPVTIGGKAHELFVDLLNLRRLQICSPNCPLLLKKLQELKSGRGKQVRKTIERIQSKIKRLERDLKKSKLSDRQIDDRLREIKEDLEAAQKKHKDLGGRLDEIIKDVENPIKERKRKKLEELKRNRSEAIKQQKLQDGINEAIANGKLAKLDPVDQAFLNSDPRHMELAYDPDTGSFKPNEARAGIRAEADGTLDPPVTRDITEYGKSGGGDLIDGKGRAWDVKDADAGANEIVKVASPSGRNPGEYVLVDASKLSAAQQKTLEAEIASKLPSNSKEVRFVPRR